MFRALFVCLCGSVSVLETPGGLAALRVSAVAGTGMQLSVGGWVGRGLYGAGDWSFGWGGAVNSSVTLFQSWAWRGEQGPEVPLQRGGVGQGLEREERRGRVG